MGCKKVHTLTLIIVTDLLDTYVCVENLTNEKDQGGWDGVAYFNDDSDSEVDPFEQWRI